jgi:hypothetical protein
MAIVKKVVEANSSRMAYLCRVVRISRAWLGVAKQYKGTVSEGLPHDRKMVSSEPASVSLALNMK